MGSDSILGSPIVRRIRLSAFCLVALIAVVPAGPGSAEERERLPGEPCQTDPLPGWSEPEKWVWGRVCEGQIANFNARYGANLDPKSAEGWKTDRELSARFLETILLHDPFRGAQTRNGVRIVGAWFRQKVDLANAKLDRQLWLDGSRFESNVTLSSLKSLDLISLQGSKFTGMLDMDSVEVGTSLFMRHAEFAEPIILYFARIGANLDLSGAEFGDLDLTGTRIDGELRLGSTQRDPPKWRDGARLTLRNTVVDALQDRRDSWPRSHELEGFTYKQLGGFGAGEGADIAARKSGWFIDWLARDESYSPQPYEQLAAVLRNAGHRDKAGDILYAGRERERETATALRWWGMTFLNYAIGYGYGYRYFYSLGWIVALVGLGVVVLRLTEEHRRHEIPLGIAYSLDMLLPIIRLRDRHYDEDIDLSAGARHYFYVHKIMGYVLASFLVAGLSGITQ